ncbi:TetR/AcrR family transcriptional regulator [Mycobacterium spongiae]|uniref:TetR family transcriptional regulator n=1 Tax=Mycobacterium spongiae TaxID=886343 RepID=A0A975JY36_9MYCO|nr:TetR/AcrR family transcriptional regulator [Mycobacterium spongiae]QUR67831.1 TetR family transcriptional regulator [Mycobacterium spongiae]
MADSLIELVSSASTAGSVDEAADRTSQRIIDAALQEAASVGMNRFTVEDVVRRAGVARMTVYRRYPRRDDIVAALALRETQRFLAAVANGIEHAEDPREGVAEAFIAAVTFARAHPMMRRAAHTDEALPPAENAKILALGSMFLANYLHGDEPGEPSQHQRWAADVFARLFLTYISMPPTDPDFGDEAELRQFAHLVLTPIAEHAVGRE